MTIQDTLRNMFNDLITFVPRTTVVMYLHKIYPQMTESAVAKALNRAIFELQCNYDKESDMISMYKAPELSKSRIEAMAKAFRVAVELMNSKQEIMHCSFPFEYAVVNGNKIYEVSYIHNGEETPISLAVGSRPIDSDIRANHVRRIAVVDYGADISYIKRVGFSKITRVNADNEVEVLESIPQEEAWLDMDDA